MYTSIKIIIDNNKLSNGKHGVYLRIIKNRKRKSINLGLKCKKDNFKGEKFSKKHPNYKSENELLIIIKNKAFNIIREFRLDNNDFTLKEFESKKRTFLEGGIDLPLKGAFRNRTFVVDFLPLPLLSLDISHTF